jgi:hypothetical protein
MHYNGTEINTNIQYQYLHAIFSLESSTNPNGLAWDTYWINILNYCCCVIAHLTNLKKTFQYVYWVMFETEKQFM